MSDDIRFNFSDDALKEAFTKSLLAQIDEQARASIIAQAIQYLASPKSGYGNKTALQAAFDQACEQLAWTVAREYVQQSPEFRAALTAAIEKIAATVLTKEDRLREVVTSAVVQAVQEGWKHGD